MPIPRCLTFEGHSGEVLCIIYPALVPLLFYCEVFLVLLIVDVVWAGCAAVHHTQPSIQAAAALSWTIPPCPRKLDGFVGALPEPAWGSSLLRGCQPCSGSCWVKITSALETEWYLKDHQPAFSELWESWGVLLPSFLLCLLLGIISLLFSIASKIQTNSLKQLLLLPPQ